MTAILIVAGVGASIAVATLRGPRAATQDPTLVEGGFGTLATVVRAIDRERNPDDAISDELASHLENLISTGVITRDAINLSRRVFEAPEIGPVYVLPSDTGFVVVSSYGIMSVIGGLGSTNPVAGFFGQGDLATDPPGLAYTYGVAMDDVEGVDVVYQDRVFPATMVENGYVWISPDSEMQIDSLHLQVRLSDGSIINM